MKAFPSEWKEFHPSTTGSSYVSNAQTIKHSEGGMDLRDYFAGQVIINGAFSATTNKYDHVTAARAYEIADAMLKARK